MDFSDAFPATLDDEQKAALILKVTEFLGRATDIWGPPDGLPVDPGNIGASDTTESSESSETSETTESSEDSESSESTENSEDLGLATRLELINVARDLKPSYDEWPAMLAVAEVLRRPS